MTSSKKWNSIKLVGGLLLYYDATPVEVIDLSQEYCKDTIEC